MKFQGYVNIREWLVGYNYGEGGNRNQIKTEMENFITYCVSSVKLKFIISVAMRKICPKKLNGEIIISLL